VHGTYERVAERDAEHNKRGSVKKKGRKNSLRCGPALKGQLDIYEVAN